MEESQSRMALLIDRAIGWFISGLRELGIMTQFGISSVQALFRKPFRYLEIVRHMEFVGNQSVFIISLTGLFTGLALSLQVYLGFKIVNMTTMVGPLVGIAITRELGPVLTGLIVAARAGGAMTARLSTMRVNEQIDALDVMGVDTRNYLVAPRILATVLCMPLLTAVFDFAAMLGAWFLVTKIVDLDEAIFWDRVQSMVKFRDINEGMVKSAVFGLFFSIICTYRGFFASGGAKGVGEATNRGVVTSMVMIIILDYFLMNLIRFFYMIVGITA